MRASNLRPRQRGIPSSWSQTYIRNPDYRQKDKGLPYLDELVIRVDLDIRRGIDDLGKAADLTITVDPENIARGRASGLGVEELRLNGGAMVLFNTLRPPFDDPRARRAVAPALDSEEINERFYAGAGTPAKGRRASSAPPRRSPPSSSRRRRTTRPWRPGCSTR